MRLPLVACAWISQSPSLSNAAEFPGFKAQELDPHVGNVCYAVTTADVDGNGKLDVVAVAEDAVVWYENPGWQKHILIKDATEKDNVCLQPHDIDGDGKVDFALGASWQPANTGSGGTLQWIRRDGVGDAPWKVLPIGAEPTLHRLRFGDVLGNGKTQLVVAPLQGRGTKGPNWGEGQGVRLLVFSIPKDPAKEVWPVEVADESLHTVHNLQITDFDDDGRNEIVVAAWEGVFVLRRETASGRWSKTQIGEGNQETKPFKGSSEVKVGRLGDGRKYVATIEPWHGFQVVVYTAPKSGKGIWDRMVVDEPLAWGHAVWCADVDGDADQELIIGQRDKSKEASRQPQGPGVFVYDPETSSGSLKFTRHVVEDGGVGTEDLVAADLDGDGDNDIIAGGRSTHNVRIYWNQKPTAAK
ncbi:FG-GAP repeat domain-containing protein [Singulisphaera sp. PoT]|uniref:FG-GAP repeat domain-containing protein n=1 Tax=Singulisphaera sp. PoT TaxID=3411797 RepID=UPI003BF5C9E9